MHSQNHIKLIQIKLSLYKPWRHTGTRWKWLAGLTPRLLYPWERAAGYPLNMRLGPPPPLPPPWFEAHIKFQVLIFILISTLLWGKRFVWLLFVNEHRAEILNRPYLEPSETNKYKCYVNTRYTVKLIIRGDADKSLTRPTSRCRTTESIVSLERRVCSCAELKVFSCYRGWNEAFQATRAVSTTSRRELS